MAIDVRDFSPSDAAAMKRLAGEIERLRLEHPLKVVTPYAVATALAHFAAYEAGHIGTERKVESKPAKLIDLLRAQERAVSHPEPAGDRPTPDVRLDDAAVNAACHAFDSCAPVGILIGHQRVEAAIRAYLAAVDFPSGESRRKCPQTEAVQHVVQYSDDKSTHGTQPVAPSVDGDGRPPDEEGGNG